MIGRVGEMNRTAYIFPGQGSQYIGMGKDLYDGSPAARAVFQVAEKVLGAGFCDLIFFGEEEELKKTVNAQPALLTMSIACLEAARESGVVPDADFVAGHSLGEYSALVACNALHLEDALRLTRARGDLMFRAGLHDPGTMAAVIGTDMDSVREACEETGSFIANLNCPGQIVISGSPEAVSGCRSFFRKKGAGRVLPLAVSGAFHSPLMKSAAEGMLPLIQGSAVADPEVPVIGNTGAAELVTADDIKSELAEQICGCVRWEASIRMMIERGVRTFYEIGPGTVLKNLLSRTAPDVQCISMGTMEDIRDGR